jgi:hypothetical protein
MFLKIHIHVSFSDKLYKIHNTSKALLIYEKADANRKNFTLFNKNSKLHSQECLIVVHTSNDIKGKYSFKMSLIALNEICH